MALQAITPLATVTLQASASTVIFGGIPNTYRDLIIVGDYTEDAIGDIYLRFNNDSASNYSNVQLSASGSATSGQTLNTTEIRFMFYAQPTTSRSNMVAQVFDYAQAKHKTAIGRVNNAAQGVDAGAGRWTSTDPISSITILGNSPRVFTAGSTFSLYGRIA